MEEEAILSPKGEGKALGSVKIKKEKKQEGKGKKKRSRKDE